MPSIAARPAWKGLAIVPNGAVSPPVCVAAGPARAAPARVEPQQHRRRGGGKPADTPVRASRARSRLPGRCRRAAISKPATNAGRHRGRIAPISSPARRGSRPTGALVWVIA
jgi:hypothetical protein